MSSDLFDYFKNMTDIAIRDHLSVKPVGEGQEHLPFAIIYFMNEELGYMVYSLKKETLRDDSGKKYVSHLFVEEVENAYGNDFGFTIELDEPLSYFDDEIFMIELSVLIDLVQQHEDWIKIARLCVGSNLVEFYNTEYE